ncbi:unnamed protein product [Sphagnum jensenii]|uniref:Uncharacterized protein n=1 Tax=Sphagnum jensenii TaxID=128206 RepID=A0ABP0W4I8_9BRYO
MARSGIAAMRVPPLVPLPSSSNSNGGGFSDSFTTSASRFSSNVKNRECCFVACTFVVPRSRGGISKFSGFGKYLRHLRQQQQLSRATVSDESSSDSTSAGPVATSPEEKEDLTAKVTERQYFQDLAIPLVHPSNNPTSRVYQRQSCFYPKEHPQRAGSLENRLQSLQLMQL